MMEIGAEFFYHSRCDLEAFVVILCDVNDFIDDIVISKSLRYCDTEIFVSDTWYQGLYRQYCDTKVFANDIMILIKVFVGYIDLCWGLSCDIEWCRGLCQRLPYEHCMLFLHIGVWHNVIPVIGRVITCELWLVILYCDSWKLFTLCTMKF